jgi:hypothetical protein
MEHNKKRTLATEEIVPHKKNVRSFQLSCNVCTFTSQYFFDLSAHYRNKHNTPYCPFCEIDDPLASCPVYQEEIGGKVKICYE